MTSDTTTEDIVLDFDGWLGKQPEAVRNGLQSHLSAVPEASRAGEKQRLGAMYAVSEATGLDLDTVNEQWDTVRGGYAEQRGGDWLAAVTDEAAFHQRLVKDVQKRRDERHLVEGDGTPEGYSKSLQSALTDAAMDGKSWVEAFGKWGNQSLGKPGWDDNRLPEYEAAASGMYEELSASFAAARPFAERALAGIDREKEVSAAYAGADSVNPIMEAPAELRPFIYALMAKEGAKKGDAKEAGGQFWQAFGRGTTGLLTGTARTTEARILTEAAERLERIQPGDTYGGRFSDLYAYATGRAADSTEGNVLGLVLEPLLSNKTATAEDIEAAKARVAKAWDELQVSADVEDMAKGLIDPIKPASWMQRKVWYPAAEGVLPYLATGSLGLGSTLLMFGGIADQRARELQTTNPGMNYRTAVELGRKSALLETGLEYLQTRIGLGGLRSTAAALQAGRRGLMANLGRNLAIQTVEQNAIEAVQDITPHVVQALSKDVPDVNWDKVLNGEHGYWQQRGDTFFALLPMVVGGAIARTVGSRFDRAKLERFAQGMDDVTLQAAGIAEADRQAILAETDAVERLRLFDETRNRRTPAEAAQGAQRMQERAKQEATALEEGMKAANVTVESISREGVPFYRVTADGAVSEHGTMAGAMTAVRERVNEFDRVQNEPLFQMLEELDANPLSPVRDSEVTVRDGQTVTEYLAERAAIMQDESATPEARQKAEKETAAMERRQAVEQAKTPDTPLDWNKMAVGGQSELQVRDGVAKAVIRVANGQSPYTALEEKTESEAGEWVRTGAVTWKGMADMIRQVEAATGDRYLNGYTEGADAKQDRTAVAEAYSELAQVHATAKGRAGKPAESGIARVARQDRKDARSAWARLREAISTGQVVPELAARLKAHVEWLKAVVTKARNLSRARQKAGAAFDIDAFLDKSVGIGPDARHAEGVVEEAERIYTPPTAEQEEDGIAFNLTSRAAPVEKNAPVREYGNATVVGPATFKIEAYHGTPHKVREFSTEKIGTGEGQQVFGWGLYFAQSLKTAEWYRETLAADGSGNIYAVELGLEDSQLLDWDHGRHSPEVKAALVAAYKAAGFNVSPHHHSGMYVISELGRRLGSPRAASEHLLAHGIRGVRYLDGASRNTKAGREFMLKFDEADLDRRADAETVMEAVDSGKFSEADTAFLRELEANDWLGFDYPAIAVNTVLSESIEDFDVSPELAAMARERMGPVNYNYVVFDEADIKITAENGKPVDDAGPTFKLTPVSTLDRLAAQMARRTRDPEQRRTVYSQMTKALDTLRRQWTEVRHTWMHDEIRPISERRTKRSLDKEQAFREGAAYAEKEQQVFESLTPSAQSALGMTVDDTSAYKGPLAQMFSGGRFGTKGRIRSRGDVMREASLWDMAHMGGEYDGAAGLPPLFFGGSLRADQAAQEAFDAGLIRDASPDTLWEAMRKELDSQAKNKKALKNGMAVLKEAQQKARTEAKAEAAAWRAEADAIQAKDWDSRAVMIRHLRTLDAILSALPPEIRGKVGGWTSIASLKSPEAMAKELEHRLKVADEHLEQHLATQALEDLEALLLRAQPDREAGKRSKGKLGADVHRFFDEVTRVFNLSPDQVAEERVLLENGLRGTKKDEDGDPIPPDDDTAAGIFEKMLILDQFGALSRLTSRNKIKSHDAAHAVAALDKLETVYTEGRVRWTMLEEARLADVAEKAGRGVASLGGPSYARSQQQKSEAGKVSNLLTKWRWDLKSFRQTMEDLFPNEMELAVYLARSVREGFAQRNDDVAAARARFRTASEVATGKKGRHAIRAIWDMGDAKKGQKITIRTAGKAINKTESIPITVIGQWKAGTADPKVLGVSSLEAADMIAAMDAMDPADNRMSLELMRGGREGAETVKMTEADGIFLTMLGRQDQYAGALDQSGFDAAALQQIEDQLSPAAKSLREHLAGEYRDGYAPLAKVFERMFGVALPQIKNYAPAAFYSMGTDAVADPTGSGPVEGGFRAGFLKNRKNHKAAPQIENAFATYFGHVNQTAHWKALAEITREMKGIFGRPDMKHAIEAAHGKPVYRAVQQWITALEGNGLQESGGELDKAVRWLANAQTYIGLAWNLGTIMKQSSAMLGSAFKMPAGAYVGGMVRFLSGQLKMSRADVFQSPVIQRRLINGFSPEVRAAMNEMWSAPPSMRMAVLDHGMELIGYTDAYFTSISAAIAYDYHYRQAVEAGLSTDAAEREAMQLTTDIVGETAQPADVVDKSLAELRMNAFGKLLFMFASEARQKSSLLLSAWGKTLTGKATRQDYQVLALSHLVLGPMMQAITAAWRDARDDDDDSWLEMDHWNPLDFLKAAVAGPLAGIPLVRDLVSGFKSDGVLGRFNTGRESLVDIFEGPEGAAKNEPVEFYAGKLSKVLQSLDAFTGVAGKVGEQAFDFTDNLIDTDSEEKVKKAQAQRKADDENRPERLTPEQKEMRRQQAIERDAARFDANNPK